MKLGPALQQILDKTYQPLSFINMAFKRYDLAFKTNEEGLPILLFMGKMTEQGNIKGERYVRVLKKDKEGNIIKDHWDLKGKST